MDLFNFIFRLGVVFAIFGFIWGLINIGIRLLSVGRQQQTAEVYLLKAVQYLLLVDVTFLICYDQAIKGLDYNSQLIFGAVILLMYFLGKFQRRQKKQLIFNVYANGLPKFEQTFNAKAEIAVISIAITTFILFWFLPEFAINPISLWFKESILDIETTPIFGFIFKIIGFFFLFNIIFKVVNSFILLLSGQAFRQQNESENDNDNDNHFDHFEEIK
ncbi:MAG: hypothetical protein M9916_01880 [Crocinitomicaceae bacterium]|nr:hypothetical protein [Crocinitomicaceae bacterium]